MGSLSKNGSKLELSKRTRLLGVTLDSNCNCNYILSTKLPWPGDSEGTFRSSSQAATCPPVYHTRWRLHTVPLIAERQAGKLWIPIFVVFSLTRPGIEPKSTALVADALSTGPLIGNLESKLTWKPHINRIARKATTAFMQCRQIVGKTWGIKPSTMNWINTAMIRPIMSYTYVS